MNTCKDCLCYNVCNYHIDEETCMTVFECATKFMPKDQYVKLPAFVGQPVWSVRSIHKYENNQFKVVDYEVEAGKVSMLQQKADKSWKIRVTIKHSVSDYTIDEFNNCLFLTEKEAEDTAEKLRRRLTE